ncbi:response regulator transcription factor [Metabacillus sp. FJAT-53654]|uniref:Response regulator n=1 Tax=Metabacillus rhizosphaerae TaxID=3117747 RepID=A0ABZ2MSG4_9BACI
MSYRASAIALAEIMQNAPLAVTQAKYAFNEASDGEEAILRAEQRRPDIILMDISMPNGLDGFTATEEITKHNKDTKIILLSMHDVEILYTKGYST